MNEFNSQVLQKHIKLRPRSELNEKRKKRKTNLWIFFFQIKPYVIRTFFYVNESYELAMLRNDKFFLLCQSNTTNISFK